MGSPKESQDDKTAHLRCAANGKSGKRCRSKITIIDDDGERRCRAHSVNETVRSAFRDMSTKASKKENKIRSAIAKIKEANILDRRDDLDVELDLELHSARKRDNLLEVVDLTMMNLHSGRYDARTATAMSTLAKTALMIHDGARDAEGNDKVYDLFRALPSYAQDDIREKGMEWEGVTLEGDPTRR